MPVVESPGYWGVGWGGMKQCLWLSLQGTGGGVCADEYINDTGCPASLRPVIGQPPLVLHVHVMPGQHIQRHCTSKFYRFRPFRMFYNDSYNSNSINNDYLSLPIISIGPMYNHDLC